MGLNLGIRRETFTPGENQSWLGSSHGTQECDSVTLDGSAFVATFTDGVVPSGVALGKITATGLYAPYNDAAVDGTEVMAGHLFTTTDVMSRTPYSAGAAQDVPAALFWHGEVVEANLPADNGVDANGKADVKGFIRYV